MNAPNANPPLRRGALIAGLLLTVLLVACDAWMKVLAQLGCDTKATPVSVLAHLWTPPPGCDGLTLVRGATLVPVPRPGILMWPLPPGTHQLWGLALFAVATVATILVVRWPWRIPRDTLALGMVWAGVAIHGSPRLFGPGHSVTEVSLAGFGTGVGDLALAAGMLWLVWRGIAEARA